MLALIALLALAAPPCPCGPNAACADARCETHGGSGACMCRFPAPKFSTAVYASVPAPKFKGDAKNTHPDCECSTCKCAACDGSCSPVATSVDGKWVVTLNGRKYTVDGSETKDDAVRLAKSAAGVQPTTKNDGSLGVSGVSLGVKPPSLGVIRTVKGHEHKCRSCGTVWAHPDNSPSASHNCPKCGRVQTVQHRDVMVPVASKPVASPAKPKRVNIGGKWYDQYADGRLVECSA